MHKIVYMGILGSLLVFLSACATTKVADLGADPDMSAYDGPKARVVLLAEVSDPHVSANQAEGYSAGLIDMMSAALVSTNRFSVMERGAAATALASGEAARSGVATGAGPGANLLIKISVTEFDDGGRKVELDANEENGVTDKLPGWMKKGIGAVSLDMAHMAVTLKVVRTDTMETVAATRVEGSARKVAATRGETGGVLGGALAEFADTPMESAIQNVVNAAVKQIVDRTPKESYRF